MRRPPIRLRLALWFTVAAAVLLTAVAGFGYERLESGTSHDLDLQLRQRAQDLIGPVAAPGASLTTLAGTGFVERGESFAEVMTPSGELLDATPSLHDQPLLSADEAAAASRGTVTFDRDSAPGLNEPARLLATPFTRSGRSLVLVVGDTRENGLENLRRVRKQLLVGIPLLVLLTFVGAYAVAGAALRPVEEMRRRAADLTAADPSLRLPVPDGDDELTRLGNTLNALLARVESTLERERSFVAHASHELPHASRAAAHRARARRASPSWRGGAHGGDRVRPRRGRPAGTTDRGPPAPGPGRRGPAVGAGRGPRRRGRAGGHPRPVRRDGGPGRSVGRGGARRRCRPGGPTASSAGADEPRGQRTGARCGRRTSFGAARGRRPGDHRGGRGPRLRRRDPGARHRAVRAERTLDRGRPGAGDRRSRRRGERRHGGGGQRSRGCRGVALAPGGAGAGGAAPVG